LILLSAGWYNFLKNRTVTGENGNFHHRMTSDAVIVARKMQDATLLFHEWIGKTMG
jgi:hypothetical protein